jgi:hypothetical protein
MTPMMEMTAPIAQTIIPPNIHRNNGLRKILAARKAAAAQNSASCGLG